jgi:hypothetical protein
MSTTIYEAFEYRGSLFDFHQKLMEFRPWILAQGEALMDIWCERTGKNPFDFHREGKKSERDRFTDARFEVWLRPVGIDHFIGHVFHDQPSWYKEFMGKMPVTECGYWNNTDWPEGMTAEEWERRKDMWDKIEGPWSENGYVILLNRESGPTPKAWR